MLEIGNKRPPIEVWESGKGKDVVYLHGTGGLMPNDIFFQTIASEFHVYAPLLPGYGESYGEDLINDMLDATLHCGDVIDALSLNDPILIGHSMGGMLAAELASMAPNDFQKLILISPLGLWLDEHPVEDLFSKLPFELPELLFYDVERGRNLLAAGLDMDDPTFLAEFLVIRARCLGMAGKLLFPIPDRGLRRRLYRIKAKTLILWGENDRFIKPVYGQAFSDAILDSESKQLPEAGHFVTHEKPDQIVNVISQFFNAL